MALLWTAAAERNLTRLHGFLEPVDRAAARHAVRVILQGVRQIARHPRLGSRLAEFEPREIRRLIVGDHELRYEVQPQRLIILRIWSTREDR